MGFDILLVRANRNFGPWHYTVSDLVGIRRMHTMHGTTSRVVAKLTTAVGTAATCKGPDSWLMRLFIGEH